MSYTTMYRFDLDGSLQHIREFRNAWGSAAAVWSSLSQKYFGDNSYWLLQGRDTFWKLKDDPRLSVTEKVAFLFTFDRAVISWPSRHEAARYLREFADRVESGCVNHLPSIADELDKLPECIGACFHQTSVSENPWKEWHDENEISIPYNILSGTNHFFVVESADHKAITPA